MRWLEHIPALVTFVKPATLVVSRISNGILCQHKYASQNSKC